MEYAMAPSNSPEKGFLHTSSKGNHKTKPPHVVNITLPAEIHAPTSPLILYLRNIVQSIMKQLDNNNDMLGQLCKMALSGTAESNNLFERSLKNHIEAPMPPKSPQERLRAVLNFTPSKQPKHELNTQKNLSAITDPHKSKQGENRDSESVVTDIKILFSGDSLPIGFEKIDRSPSGIRADLNKGGRGQFVYLCVEKDQNSKSLPISEILVIFPEKGEKPPPGYTVLRRKGVPANLNTGTLGEKIFLCFKRSQNSSIIDIQIVFPQKGESLSYGYMKVEKTPHGHPANINTSSGGTDIFLCYKKKINSMQYLEDLVLECKKNSDMAESVGIVSVENSSLVNGTTGNSTSHIVANLTDNCCIMTEEVREASMPNRDSSSTVSADTSNSSKGIDSEYIRRSSRCQRSRLNELLSAELRMIYPILFSCHIRHGLFSVTSIKGLEGCLDSGLLDKEIYNSTSSESEVKLLDLVVNSVCETAQQGVCSKFPVIQRCKEGIQPHLLHRVFETLEFIQNYQTETQVHILQELIKIVFARIEIEDHPCHNNEASKNNESHVSSEGDLDLLRSIVLETVTRSVNSVELAKLTENVFTVCTNQCDKYDTSFSEELNASAKIIFPSLIFRNVYQLLASLCKVCTQNDSIRNSASVSRKVRALCTLNFALTISGPTFRDSDIFGQFIRRSVCASLNYCLSLLVSSSDNSTCIFRVSLTVLSTLWNHYRKHLKIELALIFENIVLKILRNQTSSVLVEQHLILAEIMPWFQLPHNMIEMFLNFDMDRQFQQWNVFEQLCGSLCAIAEGYHDSDCNSIQNQSLETILAILRSLMDVSGHAHLISLDSRTRDLSMAQGWEQDESAENETKVFESSMVNSTEAIESRRTFSLNISSVRMRNEMQKRNQQILSKAIQIAQTKSVKKAIEYLVAMNFIRETSRDVSSFLRMHSSCFDEGMIGDYLGEGDEEFKVQIRLAYIQAISFTGLSLVQALRHFLTNGGFRLPGEAQKIARMVEGFAECYWQESPNIFSSYDTAMILAYSIIMLNTDLHNPQVKKNKMSKDQFVRNNRGIDDGKDIPKKMLESIYDDIYFNPISIKCGSISSADSCKKDSASSQEENDRAVFKANFTKSISQTNELIKGLSRTRSTFNFVGVDANMSPDLVKILFERIWFHFLALITSLLSNNQSDLDTILQCHDILRYSISTCFFLGMKTEREAFMSQFAKLRYSNEENYPQDPAIVGCRYKEEDWYQNIEKAAVNDPWAAIGNIHLLINELKEGVNKRQTSETLNSVAKRISRSDKILENTKYFITEGDLTKKCRSRNRVYRFFLFNDQLIYADKGISGKWAPHKCLRLTFTRIVDIQDGILLRNAFQIINPTKKFIVLAPSEESKADWMRQIKEAINKATLKTHIRTCSHIALQEEESMNLNSDEELEKKDVGAKLTDNDITGGEIIISSEAKYWYELEDSDDFFRGLFKEI